MTSFRITGGAGFIGSQTALVVLEAGHRVVVLDKVANSSPESLKRVLELSGQDDSRRLAGVEGDSRNPADLERVFAAAPAGQPIGTLIQFAGQKAVGESVDHPLLYWDVNLNGSCQLLPAMKSHGCRTLVFSSSATLYGMPEQVPIPAPPPIRPEERQLLTLNLGSGQGHSVLEVVAALETSSGRPPPPYEVVARRPGDAASTVADPSLAAQRPGSRTQRGLVEICRDGWAWQRTNPTSYGNASTTAGASS